MAKKRDQISKESAEAAEMVAKSYKDGLITLSQQDAILDKILKKQLKGGDAILNAVIQAEKQRDALAGQEKIQERKLVKAEKELSTSKDLASILGNQLASKRSLEVSMTNLGDMSKDQVKSAKENIKQTRANLKQQFTFNKLIFL